MTGGDRPFISFPLHFKAVFGKHVQYFNKSNFWTYMTQFQIKGGRSVHRRDIFDVSGKSAISNHLGMAAHESCGD